MKPLSSKFFDRDCRQVARELVGLVLWRKLDDAWLSASIVETEAYRREERGSHASLGRTPSREALFSPPGTIYMYYARGGDSLNVSCAGEGNAVLFKGARVYFGRKTHSDHEKLIRSQLSKTKNPKPQHRLLSGQTLLCRGLKLRVPDWNLKTFSRRSLYLADEGDTPDELINCRRLGIPLGRDEHLMFRWVDGRHVRSATKNPLTVRGAREGHDYRRVKRSASNRVV